MEGNVNGNMNMDYDEVYKVYKCLYDEISNCCCDKDNNGIAFIGELIENTKKYVIKDINDVKLMKVNYVHNNNYLQFQGYPQGNILLLLVNNILLCFHHKRFPFTFQHFDHFDDLTSQSITFLNNIYTTHPPQLTKSFLHLIGERGILTTLGIRTTPGSISNYIPPDINLLISHFNDKHTKPNPNNPKPSSSSILTVGARALCKHSQRSREHFWPNDKGSESLNNEKAFNLLNMFFTSSTWINIHGLPHNIAIVELRITEGYGIRWETTGIFRGFLEPQMINGHEKGWKH